MLRLLALLFAAGFLACQEPDPSYGDPGGIDGKKLPNEGATSTATSTGANGPFPSAYDGTANRPTTTVSASHTAAVAAGKQAPTAFDVPLVCSDCHKAGGAASTYVWAFGGRVMSGSAGVPNVDVIVTGGTTVGPVKTDTDGFFWSPGTPIGAGSKAAVRSAKGISSMNSTPSAGCDGPNCHQGGSAQARISAP